MFQGAGENVLVFALPRCGRLLTRVEFPFSVERLASAQFSVSRAVVVHCLASSQWVRVSTFYR